MGQWRRHISAGGFENLQRVPFVVLPQRGLDLFAEVSFFGGRALVALVQNDATFAIDRVVAERAVRSWLVDLGRDQVCVYARAGAAAVNRGFLATLDWIQDVGEEAIFNKRLERLGEGFGMQLSVLRWTRRGLERTKG